MKSVSWLTLAIVIAGAIDLGLPGLAGVDLSGLMLGGPRTLFAQIACSAIGLPAAWQSIPPTPGIPSGQRAGAAR